MAFFWVICSMSPPSTPLTFAGGDVALFYPVFHVVLITVTALSGICVKNSCDIVGKNVSVCIICVIPCQEMCFELYCNLKDVLINTLHFPLLSVAFIPIPSPSRVQSVPCLPHTGREHTGHPSVDRGCPQAPQVHPLWSALALNRCPFNGRSG